MSLNSESKNNKNDPQWLQAARQKRSSRSLELGVKAINELVREAKEITYSLIVKKSKEIDPDGKGIHQNTIRTNQELHTYYVQHSTTYKKNLALQNRRKVKKETTSTKHFYHIKLERNLNDVRKRYRQMTKEQLIDQLISAEQFIAEQMQIWISEQFKAFPK
ncbi:hypothetical protein ACFYU8_05595 [Brevibacillus sp. NPDC003359]|uniref:hypothetical protein n=1 Tax=unclassified Brevibacillus TaxID=2684853 RepID=UPI0036C5D693